MNTATKLVGTPGVRVLGAWQAGSDHNSSQTLDYGQTSVTTTPACMGQRGCPRGTAKQTLRLTFVVDCLLNVWSTFSDALPKSLG